MFLKISSFGHGTGIFLPPSLQHPKYKRNTRSVIFAVVRWLSPHPNATIRDSEQRPVCPPPFDLNHALWTFTKLPATRDSFNAANLRRQLDLFHGSDRPSKEQHADTLSKARYDLIELESIDKFINCTTINGDTETILETITLPLNM